MELDENYISLTEAQYQTGINSLKLRRWCREGVIEHIRPFKRKYLILIRNRKVVFVDKRRDFYGK
jgi:hypothetical protein